MVPDAPPRRAGESTAPDDAQDPPPEAPRICAPKSHADCGRPRTLVTLEPMASKVEPGSVSVRDLSEDEIPYVLDYWFRSPPGFVESMGADLAKLPEEPRFADALRDRVRKNRGEAVSNLSILTILHGDAPVGMHTLNPLVEGDYAIFHAHVWRPEMRGRGIAELSYPLACRLFLRRFDLKRILFKTPVQNAGAIRVKERLGIRYLGEEVVDHGILKAGTLAKVFELTREEADRL
jgi:RimJ/RimL family protein N-acetyltransferase